MAFTMELESNNHLPFLEILLIKKPDGYLGHRVFRKSTHMDLYLHSASHHHPSQKIGVLKTLAMKPYWICDEENLGPKLDHLCDIFRLKGYSSKQISRALNQTKLLFLSKAKPPQPLPPPIAALPYIEGISQKISKNPLKRGLRCTFKPLSTLKLQIPSLKDLIGVFLASGVYKIVCSCSAPYIAETSRSFSTRLSIVLTLGMTKSLSLPLPTTLPQANTTFA